MEVEFELDEADLIALAKYRVNNSPPLRRRYRRSWIGITVGLCLLGILIYILFSLKAPGVYLLAFALFFLVFYPYHYRWLMFQAATATSTDQFSRALGMRLTDTLVRKLGQTPNACWLFCSPAEGMAEMLGGIHDALGTPNIVGCTSDGEISSDGLSLGSVVLGGIVSDRIDFTTAGTQCVGRRNEAAGAELAAQLAPGTRYVQLFSDGLTGNGCALLSGMASVLGERLPIAGGTAGDAGRFEQTWQFAGNQGLTDAAVAIAGAAGSLFNRGGNYMPDLTGKTGVVVRRERLLANGVYVDHVMVNGEKRSTVSNGKSTFVELIPGEYKIFVKGSSVVSPVMEVSTQIRTGFTPENRLCIRTQWN